MLDERYLSQLPADRSRWVRVAQRLLGTPAEAEDAVQESYLRALETGAGGSAVAHEAKAWLTTVMQNLRRAADGAQAEATFHVYLQSLRNVDMQPLLGLLGQPATRALANSTAGLAESTPRARCEVVQVGGRLGLLLTLGSRFVCLLPLGVRNEIDAGHPDARAAACG